MKDRKLEITKHLTDKEYYIFFVTYTNHNASMGLKEREEYTLDNIVKVERNLQDNCLNVYYDNGEWWKYYPDYTWG